MSLCKITIVIGKLNILATHCNVLPKFSDKNFKFKWKLYRIYQAIFQFAFTKNVLFSFSNKLIKFLIDQAFLTC